MPTVADAMAKKTPPESEQKPSGKPPSEFTTTRVYKDITRMAGYIANRRGVDLFQYLDDILRPAVKADYAQAIREEAAGLDA